jgi:hypothetical protein
MEDYETFKDELAKKLYKTLQESYHEEMKDARDSRDTFFIIYHRVLTDFQTVQRDDGIYKEQIIALRSKLMQRKKSETYNFAFEQFTKEYSADEKKEILFKIANIEAHLKHSDFIILEQKEKYPVINPEKEKSAVIPTQRNFDFPIKAYSPIELYTLYDVSPKTFNAWLKPHSKAIGKLQGKRYTHAQVRIIFSIIDTPNKE